MLTPRLIGCLTLLLGVHVHALPTAPLTPQQHQALGARLAKQAGASQWQQLWQRSRQAGHLHEQADIPYFTLAPAQLIEAASLTLEQPGETVSVHQTQVMYRRDFLPQTVGKHADISFSALCLWVDWRSLPATELNSPGAYLGQVSLLLARPCQ